MAGDDPLLETPARPAIRCRVLAVGTAMLALAAALASPARASGDDVACGGLADGEALVETLVFPGDTDPAIDDWLQPHVAMLDTSVERRDLLFVFMPGSFGKPENTRLVIENAARHGYLALGLRYPNSWTVNSLCGATGSLACFEDVRLEIIDGVDRTPLISISRANSIENRLAKALAWLAAAQPDEGWARFLDGAEPRWERIIVAGHSQGGGHAPVIAKHREVARVNMFSAPNDFIGNRLADWLDDAHLTPAERYFGFSHARESGHANHLASWDVLGLDAFGAALRGDDAPDDFLGSHEIYTEIDPAIDGKEHGSTASDSAVPLDESGEPRHARSWTYLLVAPLADDDGDGRANAVDCAPLDDGAWSRPSTARSLAVSKHPDTNLTWLAPIEPGAPEVVYDLLRSGTPASFDDATCVAWSLDETSAFDGATPAPGQVFAYVVRARNALGGNAGEGSDGAGRRGPSCL